MRLAVLRARRDDGTVMRCSQHHSKGKMGTHFDGKEETMKKQFSLGSLLAPIAAAAIVIPAISFNSGLQAAEPMKIEVTMKDKEYKVKGHTLPGQLTTIVLKNEDTVTHGFSSSLFKDVQIKKEGD